MSKKWIDISVPNYQGMVHWPGDPAFETKRVKSIDRGDVCNLTHIYLSAHTGTHMDAPLHFIKNGRAMEAFPPDSTIGKARVIEIKDPVCIRPEELIPHKLKRGERTVRELVVFNEEEITDEKIMARQRKLVNQIDAVRVAHDEALKLEEKFGDVAKADKKKYRKAKWAAMRAQIELSQKIRDIEFTESVKRRLIDEMKEAVEGVKDVQREIEALVDYMQAKIVGRGPITREECFETLGERVRSCADYPAR